MAIVVNGERIEDDAIREEAERMRPEYEKAFADDPPAEREARLQEWAHDNAIERVLIEQAARAHPEPIPDAEIDEALREIGRPGGTGGTDDQCRAAAELDVRVGRVMETVYKDLPPPSDEQVQQYYDANRKAFMAPERTRAAHIVKNVTPVAPPEVAQAALLEVHKQVKAGADFAELAAAHSDCPENGGDLGYFPRGHMVEEFENVVWAMKPGEVSDVFVTQFGFHIVKVLDRRPAAPYALDEVRDEIRRRLHQDRCQQAVEAYLDDLRAKATIEDA